MEDLGCYVEFGLYPKSGEEPLRVFKLWSDIIRLCFRRGALTATRG